MLYILVCLEAGGGLDWWLNNCLLTLKPHSFFSAFLGEYSFKLPR